MLALTNSQIVQYLANGFTIVEIEEKTGIKKKTIQKRICVLKNISQSSTVAHLVANYIRKKIIE